MATTSMDLLPWIRNRIEEADIDLLREMVSSVAAALMHADVDARCGAEYGERTPDRQNSRNGYRERTWDTRVGTMTLPVPKLRNGTYYPAWLLAPRRRSEQALIAVVAECYVRGVSTRRVEGLVKTLGIERMSKSQVSELAKTLDPMVDSFRNRPLDAGPYPFVWIDALTQKVREGGRIVNVSLVIATAVNAEGHREVLGVDVVTTEDEAGWTTFLRGLVARGLSGVQLVISDSHLGLKNAIATVLGGATWQRCRAHFMRNLYTQVPKAAQGMVGSLVRSIYDQPDAELVMAQHARVVDQLTAKFPRAAAMLTDASDDILAFVAFPKEHWRQVWSNNPQERLNKELRRRTDVVGIFPNRDAVIRLVGAVLAEQNDEWAIARRYMTLDSLLKTNAISAPHTEAPAALEAAA